MSNNNIEELELLLEIKKLHLEMLRILAAVRVAATIIPKKAEL